MAALLRRGEEAWAPVLAEKRLCSAGCLRALSDEAWAELALPFHLRARLWVVAPPV